MRKRLADADKDKDSYRDDLIRVRRPERCLRATRTRRTSPHSRPAFAPASIPQALHGYASLLAGCGAAADRLDEVQEELATLQADASEARGHSRIKRLASTPRRMVRAQLLRSSCAAPAQLVRSPFCPTHAPLNPARLPTHSLPAC